MPQTSQLFHSWPIRKLAPPALAVAMLSAGSRLVLGDFGWLAGDGIAGHRPMGDMPAATRTSPAIFAELYSPSSELELGAVKSPAEAAFEFENRSNEEIHIQSIRASCNCTLVKPDKSLCKSGETGRLAAKIKTAGSPFGPLAHAITVNYRGADIHEVRLVIRLGNLSDIVIPTFRLAEREHPRPELNLPEFNWGKPCAPVDRGSSLF